MKNIWSSFPRVYIESVTRNQLYVAKKCEAFTRQINTNSRHNHFWVVSCNFRKWAREKCAFHGTLNLSALPSFYHTHINSIVHKIKRYNLIRIALNLKYNDDVYGKHFSFPTLLIFSFLFFWLNSHFFSSYHLNYLEFIVSVLVLLE